MRPVFQTSDSGSCSKRVKSTFLNPFIQFLIFICLVSQASAADKIGCREGAMNNGTLVELPKPDLQGRMSLEETLSRRESVRNFSPGTLSSREISQLLWAGQGRTRPWGARTAPSAGALFPLDLYLVTSDGIQHYMPDMHCLRRISVENVVAAIAEAAVGQEPILRASAIIVIASVRERTERKYGARAERYIAMEAGHSAQNILLQAVALALGAVPIGAFHDARLGRALNLPPGQIPVYLIAVGRPSSK